jgi:hypothetical protein
MGACGQSVGDVTGVGRVRGTSGQSAGGVPGVGQVMGACGRSGGAYLRGLGIATLRLPERFEQPRHPVGKVLTRDLRD